MEVGCQANLASALAAIGARISKTNLLTIAAHQKWKCKKCTISSVITSKPAICDHFKTGQRSRGQDMKLFYRAGGSAGKFLFISF
jgi:hypothetical protein